MLKSCRRIVFGLFILLLVSCTVVFLFYKIVLDKPGFFRQFEDEAVVRDYLLNDLTLGETNRDDAIAYMQNHLSRDESCGKLIDSDTRFDASCDIGGCLATNETVNSHMVCIVRARDVMVEYLIQLSFEHETFIRLEVGYSNNMP